MTTFKEGDKVIMKQYGIVPKGVEGIVREVEDVPPENIHFNPRIPPEDNETGVGHQQFVTVDFCLPYGTVKMSGAFLED